MGYVCDGVRTILTRRLAVWNLRNAWFLLMGVADDDLARDQIGKA
jgi:hypothetical protein